MTTKSELPEVILQIIRETAEAKNLTVTNLGLDSPVDRRLGLDSLDWAAVVVRLEGETGIDPFAAGAVPTLTTVSDLVELYQAGIR
ncbi:MAG: acyl carrier protein [Nitrospira sp.]|nr:MAG: acyl carrier protein [Nitrospira sp.]